MMDFITSLFNAGQTQTPNSMADVTVQPMAIDPSSSIAIAGQQAAQAVPEQINSYDPQLEALKQGLLVGGVNALAKMNSKGNQQQAAMAPMYRGGGMYHSPGAASFSGMNKAGGLLSG